MRSLRAAAGSAGTLLCTYAGCWNWKSAIMSGVIRSAAYFSLVARHGRHAGLRAAAVEMAYVAVTAGVYSGMQQQVMRMRPLWASNVVIVLAVPLLAQCVDYFVQSAAHTPNLRNVTVGMIFWGLLSASFHLHMMRNGAMLVGDEGRSFANDLRRIPWLVATYCAAPVKMSMDAVRSWRAQDPVAENEFAA